MRFFQELDELRKITPRLSTIRLNNINSDYTANTDQLKNCYLIANAVKNEDCMYGRDFYENSDCIDCDHIFRCTLCYECLNSNGCYNSGFLQDCENCTDCDFGYDLKNCQSCVGCVGLRKKQFHIFNQPYTKEAFLEKKKQLQSEEIKTQFEALKHTTPRIYSIQTNTEYCFGENMHHSRNAIYCFDVNECQDVMYIEESRKMHDCMDITILEDSAFCYEISSSHILNNCDYCFQCVTSSDLRFCEFVFNSKNCFGCIGLNHKEFYILNQPYSREEYFKKTAELWEEIKAGGDPAQQFFHSTYPWEDTVASWPRL